MKAAGDDYSTKGCVWVCISKKWRTWGEPPLGKPRFLLLEKKRHNEWAVTLFREFAEIPEQRCSDWALTWGEDGACHSVVGSQWGGRLWRTGG